MIAALWLAVAWAQEPATATPGDDEPQEEEGEAEEVIVYSELRVERARRAVVTELAKAGFDHEVIDLGDRVIYRHGEAWKGEVVLYDDGYSEVRRQPLHAEGVRMPWAKRNSPIAWLGCLVYPYLCIRSQGATVSERRWRNRETRTVQRVQPKVQEWADRIADLSVEQKVEGLPAMLDALWERGRPMSGQGQGLATYRERRAALLEFYGTRTDTAWGRQVQDAVRGFLLGVVQPSDHPITTRELARFNASRERTLTLSPP